MSNSTFTLRSSDLGGSFSHSQVMNSFGCSGGNVSPHLQWENAPEGTQSFAVTMHDPDAPAESGFWHWAVFNIPAGTTELKAGAGDPDKGLLPEDAFMGIADTGQKGYGGPCPPEGDRPHKYIITVHALKTAKPGLKSDTPLAQALFQIIMQHEIGRASIIAYHQRT